MNEVCGSRGGVGAGRLCGYQLVRSAEMRTLVLTSNLVFKNKPRPGNLTLGAQYRMRLLA